MTGGDGKHNGALHACDSSIQQMQQERQITIALERLVGDVSMKQSLVKLNEGKLVGSSFVWTLILQDEGSRRIHTSAATNINAHVATESAQGTTDWKQIAVKNNNDGTFILSYEPSLEDINNVESTSSDGSSGPLVVSHKIHDGECTKGREVGVFKGNGDNEGDVPAKVQRCFEACVNKKTSFQGSWEGFGDAKGETSLLYFGSGTCDCIFFVDFFTFDGSFDGELVCFFFSPIIHHTTMVVIVVRFHLAAKWPMFL